MASCSSHVAGINEEQKIYKNTTLMLMINRLEYKKKKKIVQMELTVDEE